LEKLLWDTEPRIAIGGSSGQWGSAQESSITIMPYMMMPGDDKIAASRIHQLLSKPPQITRESEEKGQPEAVAGQWNVRLEFVRGSADHRLFLEQDGGNLTGTHRTTTLMADLQGDVRGNRVRFRSSFPYEGTRLNYQFDGRVEHGALAGTVDMGEYGKAKFTAQRHPYRSAQRREG
jgi:hypothetical protein